ncbi:type II secretion system F family protein [Olsenella sp. oral taxon 807]|uniref:type II secretion system F family protein n=1 Tax=Olsenella sp. oral taxon 807 TaxID=712411 RepID=UPI00067E493F|nr:type II secretion system F family protein [Olsenella sp. oral taxon 807]
MAIIVILLVLGVLLCVILASQSNNGGELGKRLQEIEHLEAADSQSTRDQARRGRRGSAGPDNDAMRQFLAKIYVPARLRTGIQRAGVDLRPEEFALMWISATMVPSFLAYLFTNNIIAVLALAMLGAIAPPFYLHFMTNRRMDTFSTQLGDALQLISNGLKAGFSFEQALVSVRTDMVPPISIEFGRAINEMNYGMSLEDALTGVTTRMDSSDMKLLTSAVMIQRKTGGNLAYILDNLALTIRERVKLKNKIKTLTAQGRMSGYVLGSVPIVLFFVISGINPEYMSVFYTTTVGIVIVVVALLLEVLAFVIINNMTKLV